MTGQFRNHLILLIVMFIFPGCTMFKVITLVNSGEALPNYDMATVIPFSMKEHPILIKVRLNNAQKDYTFLFDTGALTLIRQEVAKELGLPKGIEVEAAGSGGKSKTIELVKLDRIIVGNTEVRDCASGVTDFSELFPTHISGIIGSNFFRHFIIKIDYRAKNITFSQEKKHTKLQHEEIIIPFEIDMINGFAPEVKCVVDGEFKATAKIDTGFPGIVSLPLSMVRKTKAFRNGDMIAATGSMTGGMFGMAEENYGLRIDEFKVGDLKLNNIPTVSHQSKNDHLLLGNKFMNKYIVMLNYPAKEMILIPYGEKFETNIPSYGLALTKHNKKTVVSGIWNNSSASNIGIKIGDEVTKVNDIETNTLSLIDLMEIFSDEKMDTVEIEFLNDNGSRKASLQKEMLLPVFKY